MLRSNFDMGKNSYIDKVLMAYLKGDANADEIKKLMAWLDESDDNKNHFEAIKSFWENSSYHVSIRNQEQAYARILEKINEDTKVVNIQRTAGQAKYTSSAWFKALAVAAIIFIIALPVYFISTSAKQDALSKIDTAPEIIKSGNNVGEKSRLILADGTVVWLNSESAIEYPAQFTGTERTVRLKGEAFFEVASDSLRPFKVASGNVTTTALGTSFNVKSYQDEDELAVTLIKGKVSVSLDGAELYFLEPGFQILYRKTENSIEKKAVDPDQVVAWKNGILLFDKDNYADVKKKLERWYGVSIRTKGVPPTDFVVTGQFRKNESLELALETLSYGRQFNYQINGKEIEIVFN